MIDTAALRRAPLLLLPGLDGTGELFTPFLAALSPERHAIVARYPLSASLGYGELIAFAEGMLPQEPCIVVGESFSGPIAVTLVARRPERVAALMLAGSFIAPPWPSWLAPLAQFLSLRVAPSFLPEFFLTSDATPAAERQLLKGVLTKLPDAVLRRRLRELLSFDAREALRRTTCPLLALRANRDRLVPHAALAHIRAARPDAAVVSIDAPHLLLQTAPEACVAAMEAFLAAAIMAPPRSS